MIEPQRKETVLKRVARVDQRLAKYRADGAAYVVLGTDGRVRVAMPGKLRAVLDDIRTRDPEAQLLELCDPECRQHFIAWAIMPKGRKTN